MIILARSRGPALRQESLCRRGSRVIDRSRLMVDLFGPKAGKFPRRTPRSGGPDPRRSARDMAAKGLTRRQHTRSRPLSRSHSHAHAHARARSRAPSPSQSQAARRVDAGGGLDGRDGRRGSGVTEGFRPRASTGTRMTSFAAVRRGCRRTVPTNSSVASRAGRRAKKSMYSYPGEQGVCPARGGGTLGKTMGFGQALGLRRHPPWVLGHGPGPVAAGTSTQVIPRPDALNGLACGALGAHRCLELLRKDVCGLIDRVGFRPLVSPVPVGESGVKCRSLPVGGKTCFAGNSSTASTPRDA